MLAYHYLQALELTARLRRTRPRSPSGRGRRCATPATARLALDASRGRALLRGGARALAPETRAAGAVRPRPRAHVSAWPTRPRTVLEQAPDELLAAGDVEGAGRGARRPAPSDLARPGRPGPAFEHLRAGELARRRAGSHRRRRLAATEHGPVR